MLIVNFRTVERIPVIVDAAFNQYRHRIQPRLVRHKARPRFPIPFVPEMMLRRLGHDVSYESAHVPGDEAGAIHHAAAAGDRGGHRTWLRHGTRPLTLPGWWECRVHLKKGKFMYAKARQRGFSGFGEVSSEIACSSA
jgi:hypothetical protein